MAPEPRRGDAQLQLPAEVMALPARLRTLAVIFYIAFRGGFSALRDTLLSGLSAWALSKISLIEYYIPTELMFGVVHLYLFFVRQSSLRATVITLRQLASRDDADDDLFTKLLVEALDLIAYVSASLLFRNISAVWAFCIRGLAFLLPLWQFIGLACVMWVIMIDNPFQTFNTEMSNIWNIIHPSLLFFLQMAGRCFATLLRYTFQLTGKIAESMVARGEQRAATRAAMLTPYQYSTLDAGTIRLLKLTKSTPWSPVYCELEPVYLDRRPRFETISYTWGNNQAMQSLIVSGRRLQVSQRVYDIVQDRTSCLMTRYIWIDAMCINQDDDNEKSSQVQMMQNIYGLSYHTVVWLGYAQDAKDAIGLIAHLHRRIQFDDPVERASRPLTELNIEHPSWPSLIRLINHNYWTRCWIIQEIAASQKTIISYGGELITWDYFSSLIETLFSGDPNNVWHISKIFWRERTSQDPIPMDAGIQITSLRGIRETIRANKLVPLFDLLIASINSTATDPRDNVYAVQGISTAVSSSDVEPAYSISFERCFLNTARYLLGQNHPSRILHLAGIGFHRNPRLQASWIPDWSTKRLARMYWRYPNESPYSASKSENEKEIDMTLAYNHSRLTVTGCKVDCIKELGPQFFGVSENGVPKTNVLPGIFKDFSDCRNMVLRGVLHEPYVTGISLNEALWRTLVGDRTPESTRPANADFFHYYQALERFTEFLSELCGPQMNSLESSLSAEEQVRLNSAMASHVTDMGRFANVMGPNTRERMCAITEQGYIGLVPPYSEIGDLVFILSGAQVPFLLRQEAGMSGITKPNVEKWRLVGETYFHGMMDGEMVLKSQPLQKIELW